MDQQRVVRLGVFAVVKRGDDILLVHQPESGRWSLPGGGVHIGESPEGALARELSEEAGLAIGSCQIIGTHDNVYDPGDGILRHGVRLLYLVEVPLDCSPAPSEEIDRAEFWSTQALPPGMTDWALHAVALLR